MGQDRRLALIMGEPVLHPNIIGWSTLPTEEANELLASVARGWIKDWKNSPAFIRELEATWDKQFRQRSKPRARP